MFKKDIFLKRSFYKSKKGKEKKNLSISFWKIKFIKQYFHYKKFLRNENITYLK